VGETKGCYKYKNLPILREQVQIDIHRDKVTHNLAARSKQHSHYPLAKRSIHDTKYKKRIRLVRHKLVNVLLGIRIHRISERSSCGYRSSMGLSRT